MPACPLLSPVLKHSALIKKGQAPSPVSLFPLLPYVNSHFHPLSLYIAPPPQTLTLLVLSAMAANSFDKENEYFPVAVLDGSGDSPVASSCFHLLNPGFDDVNQHCSLDVVPIIIDGDSFPVEEKPFCDSNGQDVYEFSMLSEESEATPQSQLAFLSLVELPVPPKEQILLDAQLSCQNFVDLQIESADSYSSCVVDIDIEMQTLAKPKSGDKAAGNIKNEDLLTRQASLKTSGRFMQLLMYHGSTLLKLISKDKSFAERVHDTPNNKWRRYKRSASFDSRKIVFLFSILSSLGSLILICLTLTLRARQTADGFGNV